MHHIIYAIDCPSHDGGITVPGARVYFGQTSQPMRRRLSQHCSPKNPCIRLRNWLQATKRRGYTIRLQVLAAGLLKNKADEIEVALIAAFRETHNLLNLTAGGGGITGHKLSAETRARMSAAHSNRGSRTLSAEHKANISAGLRGQKRQPSAAHRAAISAGHAARRGDLPLIARNLYASGLSTAQVALAIGCSRQTVSNYCRDILRPWRLDGRLL